MLPKSASAPFRAPGLREQKPQEELETLSASVLGVSTADEDMQGECQELRAQLRQAQQQLAAMQQRAEPSGSEEGLGCSTQALLHEVQAKAGPQRALELRLLAKAQAIQTKTLTLMEATQTKALTLMDALWNRFDRENLSTKPVTKPIAMGVKSEAVQLRGPVSKPLPKQKRASESSKPPAPQHEPESSDPPAPKRRRGAGKENREPPQEPCPEPPQGGLLDKAGTLVPEGLSFMKYYKQMQSEEDSEEDMTPQEEALGRGSPGEHLGKTTSYRESEVVSPILFLLQLVYCRFSTVKPSDWDRSRACVEECLSHEAFEQAQQAANKIVHPLMNTMPKPRRGSVPKEERRSWFNSVLKAWPRPPASVDEILATARGLLSCHIHGLLPPPKSLIQEQRGGNYAQVLQRLSQVLIRLQHPPTPFGLAFYALRMLKQISESWSACVHILYARADDDTHAVLKVGVCRWCLLKGRTLGYTKVAASHGYTIQRLIRVLICTEDWLARRIEERTHLLFCELRPQYKSFTAEWYSEQALSDIHRLFDEALTMSLDQWKEEERTQECVTKAFS